LRFGLGDRKRHHNCRAGITPERTRRTELEHVGLSLLRIAGDPAAPARGTDSYHNPPTEAVMSRRIGDWMLKWVQNVPEESLPVKQIRSGNESYARRRKTRRIMSGREMLLCDSCSTNTSVPQLA
jgi:hypothetical protein